MPITISCPQCPTNLTVRDELIGKAVKCPKCQTIIKVPADSPAPTPAETKRPPTGPAGRKAPTAALNKSRATPAPRVEELEEEAPRKKTRPPAEEEDEPPRKKKPSRAVEELEEARPRKQGREDENEEQSEVPEFEVPEKYRAQIEEELSKGEKLLWCGQPARRVVMVRAIFTYCIMGGIFFCVAAGLIIAGLLQFANAKKGMQHGGGMMALMGFVFLMVSVGMLLTPFYKLWQAGRTCYVMTSRRCIVWACNWYGGVDMENYNPAQLVNMFRRDMWFFGKGAGDLVFRTRTVITTTTHRGHRGGFGGTSTSVSTTYYGFLSVENVKQLERLVRETLVDKLVDKLTS